MIVTIYTPYHFCEYKLEEKKQRERKRENDSGGSSSNLDQKTFEYSDHNGRVFSPSCGYGPGCMLRPHWLSLTSLKLHSNLLGFPMCLLC